MAQLALSSFTVVIVLVYVGILLFRKHWRFSVLAQIGGLVACVVLEICDLKALLEPESLMDWKQIALIAEACLPVCWLFFALTFSREGGWRGISTPSRLLVLFSTVFILVTFLPLSEVFYSPDFADEKILFLGSWGYLFYVALMAAFVLSLFLMEQTLMSLSRPDRWRVKFEVLGVGVVLVVLVIYYSQSLLYRSLDMNLVPVRSLSLVLAVSLMAFSRFRRGEVDVRIRVSRDIAYRSVVILAVGFYLVALGLFGAGMRYINLTGHRVFFVSLAVVLGLFFVIILLSGKIRRRVRVVLHKNFYQHKYDYRKEWTQFTAKLVVAKSRETLERGILEFFAETFFLQGATLFLRDQETGQFSCSACFENKVNPRSLTADHPLVTKMCDCDWVVDLDEDDASLLAGNWAQLREMKCSFLVPLRFKQSLEGFIALGSRNYAEEALTYEDFDLMKILAHQTISVLLSRKLYTDLLVANEMAAMGRVSTFVIHDLKNLVSGLTMVVDNSRDYIDDPDFRVDMFETLDNTVDNMKGMITRLQNVKQQPQLEMSDIDLLAVAKAAAAMCGNEQVVVSGATVLVCGDESEVQGVLLNLLHNAREASALDQPIRVEVGCDDLAFVRVIDRGAGMDAYFIEHRLFRPFETTKKKGFGIGLYQCQQVIKAHGGRIDVQSSLGEGATFTIWLPLKNRCRDESVDANSEKRA
ncbi:MAG: hypothetical protein BA874_04065 [Desulfuromonadales bacterium C00003068]|jgi:putative PEP-CTERM system histidine kinase|nr:MAG: hypothetical protein BA874_04065 [Desulfuromonadales bacterium C00003068]